MFNSECAIAHAPHPFDQETFARLAEIADVAKTAFEMNVIDRSFERLIVRPNRATTGKTLAVRLMRDARKFLKVNRRREFLCDDIKTNDFRPGQPTNLELEEIRLAVAVIRDGLMDLKPRERQALSTKATDRPFHALAVKPRQFRNIVAAARGSLLQQPRIVKAYQILKEGLGKWKFETIELMKPITTLMAVRG